MPWKSEKEEKSIQSLTCFSLEVSPPQETLLPGPCYLDDQENSSLGKKVFGKFYINLPQNKRKLYALMDTASDITLIHLDLLNKLLTNKEICERKLPSTLEVRSYTNTKVVIHYDIILPCQFSPNTANVPITFRVHTQDQYPILFGQDTMNQLELAVIYGPKPKVTIKIPVKTSLHVVYDFENKADTVSAYVRLKPQETKNVIFHPHLLNTLQKHTSVLISNSSSPNVHVVPTRYLSYQKQDIPFIACVTNLSNSYITEWLEAKVTDVTKYDFLGRKNKQEDFTRINLVQHEVLSHTNAPSHLPVFQLLNGLPDSRSSSFQSVSSYLLKTPFESKVFTTSTKSDMLDNNPTQDQTLNTFGKKLNSLQAIQPTRTPSPPLEMPDDLLKPSGYEIPCNLISTVSDIINMDTIDPLHRPFIKDIFIDKYPTTIALHQFDIGQISKTLGYYKIELKDGETLPLFRRIYYMNSHDAQQLKDITDFLIKYKIITKTTHQDKVSHLYGSAGYLVPRSNKHSSARLVIDYSLTNQVIKTSPPTIPSITSVLQSLRGCQLFSTTDLTSAYYSVELDPECRHLTRFCTQNGSFTFNCLPMGLHLAPQIFAEVASAMIHKRPKLDKNGKPIYIASNIVQMEHDPLPGVHIFYDDVLMATKMCATYEDTLAEHYKLVEKVMERMAYHRAKISFEKSEFGKHTLTFLGWQISNNFLLPDPKRTSKLLTAPFPENIKAMRSFLGLLNTLRMCMPHTFLDEMAILNPLTSATTPYKTNETHKEAFEKIKKLLTSYPIFSNIIDPSLKKILFVDASDKGNYSAVLCQLLNNASTEVLVPDHLLLDDPVDRIIYSFKLCYESVPLYLHDDYIPRSQLVPPYQKVPYKDPAYLKQEFLGYPAEKAKNSSFYALQSVLYAYNNTMLNLDKLLSDIKEKMKKSIFKYKIIENFNNNEQKYKELMKNMDNRLIPVDEKFLIFHLIAQILSRPIIIISALPEHKENSVFKFEYHIQKPPIVLGVQTKSNLAIFTPYFVNKNSSFLISELNNRIQIVAFWAKAISPKDFNKTIMEKECCGLMSAVEALKPLFGQSELLILTDSKPLFLLYSNPVTQSSSKLCRWGLKLSQEHKNIKLRFISTRQNLSDYLTRDYNISKLDFHRLPLKNISLPCLDEYIDPYTEFTVDEWKHFVLKHEHLLQISDTSSTKLKINAINNVVKHMKKVLDPLEELHAKMSHDNIVKEQEKEFVQIINFLITQPNMEGEKLDQMYKLINGVLYTYEKERLKLVLPQSLEGIFISFTHLAHNHLGAKQMAAALQHLHFPQKTKKILHLTQRCYGCSLQNATTAKLILGSTPVPEYMFQYLYLDLLENLPVNRGFSHILIAVCPFSKFVLTYPLKNKKSFMVCYNLIFGLYQFFNIQYVVSDNGPAFASNEFLTLMATLNIKKIRIAATHPISNGLSESFVKKVKYILKKTLATFPEFTWLDILAILTKQFNSTLNPLLNVTPLQILHGASSISAEKAITDRPLNKIYPLLQNIKSQVEERQKESLKLTEFIRNEIHQNKIKTTQTLNQNRTHPNFHVGQFVFIKDKTITPGTTRPLKTTYKDDPCVILNAKHTTALVRRLGDGYMTVYGYNDMKAFNALDPEFSHLPQSVKDVLLHKYQDFTTNHYKTIRKYATLDLPENEPLYTDNIDDDEQILLPAPEIAPVLPPPALPPPAQDSINSPPTPSPQLTPINDNPPVKSKPKQKKIIPPTTRKLRSMPSSDSESENSDNEQTKRVQFS